MIITLPRRIVNVLRTSRGSRIVQFLRHLFTVVLDTQVESTMQSVKCIMHHQLLFSVHVIRHVCSARGRPSFRSLMERAIHCFYFPALINHPSINEFLVLGFQLRSRLSGQVEFHVERDNLILDILVHVSMIPQYFQKGSPTLSNLALPLNSSSLSLSFCARLPRSLESSSISLPSALLLALSLASSASATFIRDWICPLERRASARSLRSWTVPSVGAAVLGLRGLESGAWGSREAFSASSAVVRSRSCVTVRSI